jgi:hypothetical protein
VAAVEFAAVERADAPDPSLVNDLPIIVLALDLFASVLVHEVDDDALGSVVCHTRRIGDVSD